MPSGESVEATVGVPLLVQGKCGIEVCGSWVPGQQSLLLAKTTRDREFRDHEDLEESTPGVVDELQVEVRVTHVDNEEESSKEHLNHRWGGGASVLC